MKNITTDGSEPGNKGQQSAYVLTVGDNPIGGLVVEQEEMIAAIRTSFDIEKFIEFEQLEPKEHFKLTRCSIAPGFHCLTRFLLSETMRLSGSVALYQRVSSMSPQSPTVRDMLPVNPRDKIHFDMKKLAVNAPEEATIADCQFGLMMLSKKYVTMPNRGISHSIVVVGASDVGMSALHHLAMSPHLVFNNLTLVSPTFHDDKFIPARVQNSVGKRREPVEPRLINNFGQSRVGISVCVNRVRATMAGIQTSRQRLILKDGSNIPYDLLLLATGKQPPGVVCDPAHGIGGPELGKLLKRLKNGPERVFIFGDSVESLALVNRLLENDISPDRITLGLKKTLVDIFNIAQGEARLSSEYGPDAESLAAFVEEPIKKLGIDLVDQIEKIEILGEQSGQGKVKGVMTNDQYEYECDIFINLNDKQVDQVVFKTLNKACLVYDGALIVDTNFRTSNDLIMAAGPLTKYPRRLHAEEWTHEKFNSGDIGTAVGAEIIKRVFGHGTGPSVSVPRYKSPLVQSCTTPSGIYYLSVQTPTTDRLTDGHKQNMQRWLKTNAGDNLSRIHLDPFGNIDRMQFLSKNPLPIENLIRLFGLHESYLNNLVARYDEELVPCLLSHVCQSGLQAVTHDRFKKLVQDFDDLMPLDIDDITPHTTKNLREEYSKEIDRKVFEFLEHNKPLLTMYQMP